MAETESYNKPTLVYDADKLGNRASAPSLSGGGGDGTSGGMEARVAQLETDMREVKGDTRAIRDALLRIEGKLDTKATAEAVAEIKGKLDAKASAADLGTLSGRVDDRPTTWKVVVIVIALGAIMAGSQIVKAVSDAIHSTPATTKAP